MQPAGPHAELPPLTAFGGLECRCFNRPAYDGGLGPRVVHRQLHGACVGEGGCMRASVWWRMMVGWALGLYIANFMVCVCVCVCACACGGV